MPGSQFYFCRPLPVESLVSQAIPTLTKELSDYCTRWKIAALEVFGSAVTVKGYFSFAVVDVVLAGMRPEPRNLCNRAVN